MTERDQLTVADYLAGRVPLVEARGAFIRWAAWLDTTGRGVPHWIASLANVAEAP
jgi:hypothetical protein